MTLKLLNSFRPRTLWLVLMTIFAFAGEAWAADEVYKTALFGSSYNSKATSSYEVTWSATNNGFTVNLTNFSNYDNRWDYVKCGRSGSASVATITTAAAIDKAITKVDIKIDNITAGKVNEIRLYTRADGTKWTSQGVYTKATGVQSVSIKSPAANLYYKIEFNCASGSSNGLVQVSKVEFYSAASAATPTFSHTAGAVASGTEVAIATATDGATIYYTTDGTDPTKLSTVYKAPIVISATTTIKAIAVKDGLANSSVASAEYTIGSVPTITLDTNAIAAAATGAEGTLGVTYNDFDNVQAEVQFFEADGTTPATYSWLTASINEQTFDIDYVIASNTGSQRKAYMRVCAQDASSNEVSSELITITQGSRDFVTLPFSYDEDAQEAVTGITMNGLGVPYGSSPKIRFDDTGDYLIIKLNGAPVSLTFDIVGMSFSGGTFAVQTSVDGDTYTDLATYTTLSSYNRHELLRNIPSDVRYIKWLYRKKSSGNVALGNITVGYDKFKVGSTLYTALVTNKDVSIPTGITAYIATQVNASSIQLQEVTDAPANTPLILKADAAGTYTFGSNYAGAYETQVAETPNLLQVSDGTISGSSTIYALANKDLGVGFYPVSSSITVPSGKPYLQIGAASVKGFLGFDYNLNTGLTAVSDADADASPVIYNLAGQRLSRIQKGINIINGKKVLAPF